MEKQRVYELILGETGCLHSVKKEHEGSIYMYTHSM